MQHRVQMGKLPIAPLAQEPAGHVNIEHLIQTSNNAFSISLNDTSSYVFNITEMNITYLIT